MQGDPPWDNHKGSWRLRKSFAYIACSTLLAVYIHRNSSCMVRKTPCIGWRKFLSFRIETGNVACFTFGELFLTNSCRQAEYQVLRVDWLNIIGQSHVEYNLISQSQNMIKKSGYFNFFRLDWMVL